METRQQTSRYWLVMLIMDSVRPVRCVRAGGQYFTFYRAGESLTQNSSGPATNRNVPPPPSPPRCYCVSGVVWTTFMDGQFRGEGNLIPLLLSRHLVFVHKLDIWTFILCSALPPYWLILAGRHLRATFLAATLVLLLGRHSRHTITTLHIRPSF